MDQQYIENNLLKISDYLLKTYSEIWSFTYPYFRKFNSVSEYEFSIGKSINIYMHAPFCVKKCKYCSYFGDNDIYEFGSERYTDLLLKELDFYLSTSHEKPHLGSLLFGGGTPTLLDSSDILRIMEKIHTYFTVDETSQFTIESTPGQLSDEKIQAIRDAGFHRISIGVQSFDENELIKQNRFQKNIIVYNAFKLLRKHEFPSINIDLIYGLQHHETIETFLKANLHHILKLQPDSIDIYPNQDISNNPDLVNIDMINDINDICRLINDRVGREIAFTQLNVGRRGTVRREDFPYNRSKYTVDRRILLNQTISLGLGAVGNFLDSYGNLYFYTFDSPDLVGYEKFVNEENFSYKFKFLNYKDAIKYYFIRNLRLGINKKILQSIFPEQHQLEYIRFILKNIQTFIDHDDENIFLKMETLDFSYSNDNLKYFLFTFYFIYDEADRLDFYENIRHCIS